VSADRIINMLNVANNHLVLEEKGIYSIEKFIIARRLMYWQVYLHKAVLAAETLLRQIILRAVYLANQNIEIYATPFLKPFIQTPPTAQDFDNNSSDWLDKFALLDDSDIFVTLKAWQFHSDKVLSTLSYAFMQRKLPKIIIKQKEFTNQELETKKAEIIDFYKITSQEADYFVQTGFVENNAYKQDHMAISIIRKSGEVVDVTEVSDNYNLNALKQSVKKFYLSAMRIG
jgi:HD superfamily phosphohydrolase